MGGLWTWLAEATNEAHHRERGGPVYRAVDARAILLATAVALEYLQGVLGLGSSPVRSG